jgi:hypothetical protein
LSAIQGLTGAGKLRPNLLQFSHKLLAISKRTSGFVTESALLLMGAIQAVGKGTPAAEPHEEENEPEPEVRCGSSAIHHRHPPLAGPKVRIPD